MKKSKKQVEDKQSNILAVIQRILVQSLIIIACWHIITVWLHQDTDWFSMLLAFLWSGNMFWFKDYSRWFDKIT